MSSCLVANLAVPEVVDEENLMWQKCEAVDFRVRRGTPRWWLAAAPIAA